MTSAGASSVRRFFRIGLSSGIPSWKNLAGSAVLLLLLTALSSLLNESGWRSAHATILWLPAGFLLALLLCSPLRLWPAYLLVAVLCDQSVHLAHAPESLRALWTTFTNLLEVGLAAALLRRGYGTEPVITQRRWMIRFVLYGVILGPAVASALTLLPLISNPSQMLTVTLEHWFLSASLGVAVATPLCLALRRAPRFNRRSTSEVAGLLGLLLAITVLVFRQPGTHLLFLVLPCLLLLALRLRLAGSALGLLMVQIIGGLCLTNERLPAGLKLGAGLSDRILRLQAFIAVSMLVLYIVEVVIAESILLRRNLERSETRFRLLAEVSRDIIVLYDLNGHRQYISPAVTALMGWEPGDMVLGDFSQIVHPDDILLVREMFESCRQGNTVPTLSYRCRKSDGEYIWVESNLQLYRDPDSGEALGFVNVARDISQRKQAEDKLKSALHLVEELASRDGLTGLANRRRLDTCLDLEWRRAIRDRSPLSVLLIDVDHFKRYNDLYGHLSGDNCLRQIAATAQALMHRPGDVLARFGGEEFVVILPNTESAGAEQLADQLRIAVEALAIPHTGNNHNCVTVSIGCATQIPDRDAVCEMLLEESDRALYVAKSLGRNRTEVSKGPGKRPSTRSTPEASSPRNSSNSTIH